MTSSLDRLLKRAQRRRGLFWTRRRWVAESLARSEGSSAPIRKALALENVLRKMPVRIARGELIVALHPESIPPADAPRPPALRPPQDPLRLPEEYAALRAGLFTSGAKTGHLTPDYPGLLTLGFGGMLGRIEERQQSATDPQQEAQLEAMAVTVRAAANFARRYARLAARLASQQTTPDEKSRLKRVADACTRVADQPPRSLHEALQLLWFAFLIQCIEEGESTAAFALGRFDQYMLPFWTADLAGGRDREELVELIGLFWVKLNEFSGMQVLNLTLGGTDREGRDAVNHVSFACLELMERMRSFIPSLSVRWHAGIDPEFFRRALRLAASGAGQPAFYCDPEAIRAMTNAGVAPGDAVDVVPGGCVELGVQGCCYPWVGNFINLPKCLELALHNGVDPGTGEQVGPVTGAPGALDTFGAVVDAYERQVAFFMDLMARSENTTDRLEAEHNPYPFLSALVSDCVERGRDITAGGARYNFTEVQAVGVANVVDSLLNVRRLVYESSEMGLAGLVAKLDADFADDEPLRRRLAAMKPAYGQNAPETAALARRIAHGFFDCVEKYENPRGGRFRPGLLVWTLYDVWADHVGALPDGRRRGEPLVSSIGPREEAGVEAPTLIVRDATAFDHFRCAGGLTLNLRFDDASVRTDAGPDALARLLEVYFSEGGMQVQLNAVDGALLRRAQERPAAHRGLIVRVSGFSAHYTALPRVVQEDILARTEHRAIASPSQRQRSGR